MVQLVHNCRQHANSHNKECRIAPCEFPLAEFILAKDLVLLHNEREFQERVSLPLAPVSHLNPIVFVHCMFRILR